MKLKGIMEYILRVGLFLLLNRQFAYMSLFTFIANLLPRNNIIKDDWAIFGLMFICLTITCSYLIAKICGIFKKLDKLNIVSGFVVICILNYILNISLNCSIQIIPIRISYIPDDNFWYFYPFLFIYYRILNRLAQKFPNTFGKIGYYFSIEFYKNIFNKLMSKIKNMG